MCHRVRRLGGGRGRGRWRLGDDGCSLAVSREKEAYNGNGIRVPVHADGQIFTTLADTVRPGDVCGSLARPGTSRKARKYLGTTRRKTRCGRIAVDVVQPCN